MYAIETNGIPLLRADSDEIAEYATRRQAEEELAYMARYGVDLIGPIEIVEIEQ